MAPIIDRKRNFAIHIGLFNKNFQYAIQYEKRSNVVIIYSFDIHKLRFENIKYGKIKQL